MTTIDEAREQARAAQEQISNRLIGSRLGLSSTREMDKDMLALSNGLDAISALLDATEPPANVTDRPKSDIPAGQMSVKYADGDIVADTAARIACQNSELMARLADKPAELDRYDDFCPTCDAPVPTHTAECAVPFRTTNERGE